MGRKHKNVGYRNATKPAQKAAGQKPRRKSQGKDEGWR